MFGLKVCENATELTLDSGLACFGGRAGNVGDGVLRLAKDGDNRGGGGRGGGVESTVFGLVLATNGAAPPLEEDIVERFLGAAVGGVVLEDPNPAW